MRNIWVITDTHFGHDKLVQEKLRPKNFETKILRFLNNNVGKDDITIHLGDIAFSNEDYWNIVFNMCTAGKKWHVKGNHDKRSTSWYLEHGWDFCADQIVLNQFDHKIVFSHIPIKDDNNYTINIHGHFHNFEHRNYEPELVAIHNEKQYLIAIENTCYQALTLNSIIKKFEKLIK